MFFARCSRKNRMDLDQNFLQSFKNFNRSIFSTFSTVTMTCTTLFLSMIYKPQNSARLFVWRVKADLWPSVEETKEKIFRLWFWGKKNNYTFSFGRIKRWNEVKTWYIVSVQVFYRDLQRPFLIYDLQFEPEVGLSADFISNADLWPL